MKTIQKYLAVLMMVLLCVGILTMPAHAATKSQDGVEVTLTTDKDVYSQGENIVATLTVKNTNDVALLNVSMESLIPDGYVLSKGDGNTMQVDRLEPGETTVLKVTFVAETDQSGTSTPDTPETTPNRPNPGRPNHEPSTPNTDDNRTMVFWLVLLIVAVVGIIVLTVKYKLWKKMLAVVLCMAMLLPMFGQISVQAKAAKVDTKIVDVSTIVKVEDKQVDVKAMVSYQLVADEDPEDPEGVFYTVTFETNGGSKVKAQTVAKGETATEPDTPVLEGNTFINWYADAELTTVYDFSAPINSNITLYAAWEVDASDPDNAVDEEDTEVSKDDKCILTASESEVLANSNTEVMFYVNSTLTVSYFELYINGESTGVKLYDNGDYSETGDDIPNDGCYTGVYTVDLDVEEDIIFTAKATVGKTVVFTNEVCIFVYYELTDEQCSFMDQVSLRVKQIIEETRANMPEESSGQEIAESIFQALNSYLVSVQDEGKIASIFADKESYTISFTYADTGIFSSVTYYKEPDGEIPVTGPQKLEATTDQELNPQNATATSSVDIDVDYITYKEKALFLIYCEEDVTFDEDGAGNLLVESSKDIATLMKNAGFETEFRYSVSVEDFKTLQDYQYIRIACHGSYVSGLGIDNSPVICTDHEVTSENRKTYSADLKKQRLFDATTVDDNGNVQGTFYWIHPDFFTFYYDEDPLKANIVHVSCCKGAYKKDLVDALIKVGADSIVAYTDTVYTKYDGDLWTIIVPELLKGNSVEHAVNSAINEVGASDHEWFYSISPNGTPKKEVAKCRVYGEKSTLLHNTLENGTFDAWGNLFGNKIDAWKMYGDARSVFKLSGIKPNSSPKMAIISSGFGSMNDETTSCIYQTFLVPENANTLKFSYDIVSEEPMEYVGSEYDDIFQVDILSTDGDILETLAFESVNTSTWYAVDGINFPGGDDTTYHTRWRTVTNDIISAYRGQLIVLRFAVQDTSDTIYDTAALIDSVSIT